jgi:hypothetical protein
MSPDWLGWVATALVVVSYLVRHSVMLRRIQGASAALWLLYGIAIHSQPVIVANIIVMTAALATSLRPSEAKART